MRLIISYSIIWKSYDFWLDNEIVPENSNKMATNLTVTYQFGYGRAR